MLSGPKAVLQPLLDFVTMLAEAQAKEDLQVTQEVPVQLHRMNSWLPLRSNYCEGLFKCVLCSFCF